MNPTVSTSPERADFIKLIFVMEWLSLTGLSMSAELLRNDCYIASFRVLLRDKPFIIKVETDDKVPVFQMYEEAKPTNMAMIPYHITRIDQIYDTVMGINQELYQY